MDTKPLVVERVFNSTPEKIWKAITEKEEMKKWYFDLAEFRAEKGFRFEFTGGPSPEKQYKHLCEVIEAIPEKKLSYSWRYEGYPGISYVSFEIIPQGERTMLRLTHSGLETFPEANPDLARHNFEAGWNDIINRSLKQYLEDGK